MELLTILLEKFWLRYKSIPIVVVISAFVLVLKAPKTGEQFTPGFWILLACLTGVSVFYAFETFYANKLHTVKQGNTGILFIVLAEDRKAYEHVKYCLVLKFEELSKRYGDLRTQIICLPQYRCTVETFHDKHELQKVLQKTNCLFAVRTRYTVDDVDNAENFEMCIEYGLLHPALRGDVQELLSREMNMFSKTIQRQRFSKCELIETFDVTALRLSMICEYFLGVSCLIDGNYKLAKKIFIQIVQRLCSVQPVNDVQTMLNSVARIRIVESCIGLSRAAYSLYRQTKSKIYLYEYREQLEEMNYYQPGTYGYFLDSAMLAMLIDRDPEKAEGLIEKCKAMRTGTDWKFSDAFLAAYNNGMNPWKVYRKYQQAFNADIDIMAIVIFIEDFIDEEPEHGGLHFALGLIYHEIGDPILMRQHFEKYRVWLEALGKESGVIREIDRMEKELPCGTSSTCSYDCLACTYKNVS